MSQLADRVEIAELVDRLARVLDERRFDDLRTIYAPAAQTQSRLGTLRGIDEIIQVVRRASSEDELAQHLNMSVVVDLDGDQAKVSASQLVYFFREGESPHRAAGLRTGYTAERTPAGWRFTRAEIAPLWQQDLKTPA